MIFGAYLLSLAAVAGILSLYGYFQVARGNVVYALAARWSYYVLATLIVVSAALLVGYLIGDRFDFAYVSSYSSISLPINFKISSLWAGQEGSFLLWMVMAVLLGLWVKAKARDQVGWVMFFFLIALGFLMTMLIISSPFKQQHPVPGDGRSLNPLLQNYWMQIHPPIVFLGFASTFIPFAFAMAALVSRKYDDWVKSTFPWAILSVCTLGAGTFLGGYWAYETLGWGGYWAWDPVENAILVPWLGSIALVHGMVLERTRGTFRKTNLFLAITAFLMTIYGTFLTRSGVLADFSVHSFVDLGYTAYLAIFLLGFTVISYGLLLIRSKSIPASQPAKSPLSREFAVYLGMLFVIVSGFLVLIGMSAPLLTRIWGDPSAVSMDYYVTTNLPIGIVIGIAIGMAPLLGWRSASWNSLKVRFIWSAVGASTIMFVGVVFGVRNFAHLAFLFTSAFALMTNSWQVIEQLRKGNRSIQADLIHAGVAIMFIGIIASAAYSSQRKVSIEQGSAAEAFNFTIKFHGTDQLSPEKTRANLTVDGGSSIFAATPVFLQSNQGLVRNPFIKKYLFYDLYISPEEIRAAAANQSNALILAKGESRSIGGLHVTFNRFDVGSHMDGGMMQIGADLTVETADGRKQSLVPKFIASGENPGYIPAVIEGDNRRIYLLKISADQGLIMIGLTDKESAAEFEEKLLIVLDVGIKPLINLVWLGLILIVGGAGWSTAKRIKECK